MVHKSLAFALKNRIQMPTHDEEEGPVMIRAQPLPRYGVSFKPHIPEAETVEICPFSVDFQDKECQL